MRLRIKLFARKDYEGLSEDQIKELRKRRSDYASSLRKNYRSSMDDIRRVVRDDTNSLTSKGRFTGGGLETSYAVESTLGKDIPQSKFGEYHSNSVRNELLNQSGRAKKLLRENVEKEIPNKSNNKMSSSEASSKNKKTIKELVLKESKDSKKSAKKPLNLKRVGKYALGTAAVAGTAYVGKKAYDHYKNKKKLNK